MMYFVNIHEAMDSGSCNNTSEMVLDSDKGDWLADRFRLAHEV